MPLRLLLAAILSAAGSARGGGSASFAALLHFAAGIEKLLFGSAFPAGRSFKPAIWRIYRAIIESCLPKNRFSGSQTALSITDERQRFLSGENACFTAAGAGQGGLALRLIQAAASLCRNQRFLG